MGVGTPSGVPAPNGVKKNIDVSPKCPKHEAIFAITHTKPNRKKKDMKTLDHFSSNSLCIRGVDYIETRIDKKDRKYKYLSRRCVFRSEDIGANLPQIRSMFVHNTKKPDVYSILVVAATPRRNSKDDIVVSTARYMYRVNIRTNNVWIKLTKKQNSFFVPPGSWRTDEWKQSVVMNTKKALGLII